MFYRGFAVLDPVRHLGFGLRPRADLSATHAANAVPLGADEFWDASAHYPIVFGPAGAAGFPLAITAIVEGRNLFLDADGGWRAGAYLPYWLRRYPFWMQPAPDGQSASLWFDPQGGQVVPLHEFEDARPLFSPQGRAAPALEQAAHICRQALAGTQRTHAFMAALEHSGALTPRQVTVELAPGQPYTLSGFRVIDMDAYRQLPDATLALWARNGWAALAALHELSMQRNWASLLALHRGQSGAPG
jgi:hypothetical protein